MPTAIETSLRDVLLIEPDVFADDRGTFFESWNAAAFSEVTGVEADFVQDNHATSSRNVVRGLHYQLPPHQEGKLVRVARGAIFDVAVDIRRSSPTFGRWQGVELTAENHRQVWIPGGFAHGYATLSETVDVLYKSTAYYSPEAARSIRWDDPAIGIEWPIDGAPMLSARDAGAPNLADAELFD